MYENIKEILNKQGFISKEVRSQYFSGKNVREIRNQLAELELNPHTCIELDSIEIALVTPSGILMQLRDYDEEGIQTLGLLGGVIEEGETPEEAARREIKEETGLDINITEENFFESNTHFHKYANGDIALFHTRRYVVKLDYVPKIKTDDESVGTQFVKALIISHQREFVKEVLRLGL